MAITVRKFSAQVKDPSTGNMVPAGLLSSDALGAIDDAKDDAIDAIVAQGTTTRESIPSDYTALSDEVDELKNALNDLKEATVISTEEQETEIITPEITWTNGYTTEDGTAYPGGTDYHYSNKFAVQPGDVINVYNEGSTDPRINVRYIAAFNDSSAVSASGGSMVPLPYTVPENIDGLVITVSIYYSGDAVVTISRTETVETLTPVLKSDVDALEEETEFIKSLTITTEQETETETIIPELTWTNGYTTEDGTAYPGGTDYHYSNKFAVQPGDVINVYNEGSTDPRINVRYIAAFNDSSAVSASGGSMVPLPYTVPENIDGLVITVSIYYSGNATVKISRTETTEIQVPALYDDVNKLKDLRKLATRRVKGTGNFTQNNDFIICPIYQEARKGSKIVFECRVTSGTNFNIGFSTSKDSITSPHNVIQITNEKIISPENIQYSHGLTIAGNVQVVFEKSEGGVNKVSLICNGNKFTQEMSGLGFTHLSVPYAISQGLIATDCTLIYTNTDLDKKIYMFGDSYTSIANTRWPYYANEDGYLDNVLLDGFSGEGALQAVKSLPDIIETGCVKNGEEKLIVWLIGMNDNSDPNDTTPSNQWINGKNKLLEVCEEYGLIPVFATIPSVKGNTTSGAINNKGKNYWIRNSGYRYIDFEKAVGADLSNEWYAGMLNPGTEQAPDYVHPTDKGAIALYTQLLLDLPEIMIED